MTPEGLVERPGYDIEEFVQAQVFMSAQERERIRRLEAEEESLFTPMTGPARRGGRVTGLTQQ